MKILVPAVLALIGLAAGGLCNMLLARIDGSGAKTSFAKYPAVIVLNGLLWLLTAALCGGEPVKTVLYCLMSSLLTAVAVTDWRRFEIPDELVTGLLLLGLVRLLTDIGSWRLYLAGFFAVSLFFLLIWLITCGEGIGMGDVKLMAAAGLLLGWKNILLAMFAGCIIAAAVHVLRMKGGAERRLAFGPYLSAGIWLVAMFGDRMLAWYLGMFGF